MPALSVVKTGRPPVLDMARKPTPAPGPGEVLLRVDACGFCHHDLLVTGGTLRRGVAPSVTLGHEIAATVVAVSAAPAPDAAPNATPGAMSNAAPDATTDARSDAMPDAAPGAWTAWRPGDRAVSLLTAACGRCDRCRAGREHRCRVGGGIGHRRDGGFAGYIALPATALVPIPPGIPPEQAALLACPAGVALHAVETAGVAPGDTVVVTGAGGGLGSHAVQLAAMRGAQVIAATASPRKIPLLETLGAAPALEIDAHTDLAAIVMAITGDRGADAVIDTVGPPLWPATMRCLGQYGRLALLGDVTGEPAPLRPAEVIFRDLRITGVSGVSRAQVERAAALAAAGRLRPVLAQTLPLTPAGVSEAWRMVSERRASGRVALIPGDD